MRSCSQSSSQHILWRLFHGHLQDMNNPLVNVAVLVRKANRRIHLSIWWSRPDTGAVMRRSLNASKSFQQTNAFYRISQTKLFGIRNLSELICLREQTQSSEAVRFNQLAGILKRRAKPKTGSLRSEGTVVGCMRARGCRPLDWGWGWRVDDSP